MYNLPDHETYDEIARLIHSDKSPVGIDAKKTHVFILHQLEELHKKLDRIERLLLDE